MLFFKLINQTLFHTTKKLKSRQHAPKYSRKFSLNIFFLGSWARLVQMIPIFEKMGTRAVKIMPIFE